MHGQLNYDEMLQISNMSSSNRLLGTEHKSPVKVKNNEQKTKKKEETISSKALLKYADFNFVAKNNSTICNIILFVGLIYFHRHGSELLEPVFADCCSTIQGPLFGTALFFRRRFYATTITSTDSTTYERQREDSLSGLDTRRYLRLDCTRPWNLDKTLPEAEK